MTYLKIAELALNNDHSLTHSLTHSIQFPSMYWLIVIVAV